MSFKPEDEQAAVEAAVSSTTASDQNTDPDFGQPAAEKEALTSSVEHATESYSISPLEPLRMHESDSKAEFVSALDVEGTPEEVDPSGWQIAKAVIREVVETVVLTLIIFFLIQLVIKNFRVDGHSMDPNLHHGQYLVVDKISYRLPLDWRPPQRGDVIVFAPPTHPDKDFVKRIIALPGETIELRQGQIYVNNTLLAEPYQARQDRYNMAPRTVPAGHYFVMGDNRGNSNDSRNWGTLEAERIVGRAWVSYWPPSTWGVIPKSAPTDSATLFSLFENFRNAEAAP